MSRDVIVVHKMFNGGVEMISLYMRWSTDESRCYHCTLDVQRRSRDAIAMTGFEQVWPGLTGEDEYIRIEKAGGKVIRWDRHHVFGALAISRSIGMLFMLLYNLASLTYFRGQYSIIVVVMLGKDLLLNSNLGIFRFTEKEGCSGREKIKRTHIDNITWYYYEGESSHWQYKFPLPVEGVPTARRMEIPLSGVCTAMIKKLPVKEN
nr:abscisic acid insensitivity 1B [Tanacetum cinerariifolium]